jgi:hypothetical protein
MKYVLTFFSSSLVLLSGHFLYIKIRIIGFTAVSGIFLQTEVLFATVIIISFMIELYMIKLT